MNHKRKTEMTEESAKSKNISLIETLNELYKNFPKDKLGRMIESYLEGLRIIVDPFESEKFTESR